MYVSMHRVRSSRTSLYITFKYFIAPYGERVFAILGEDRILYVPVDSNLGKEYAVRVVKGTGWNIRKIKVGRVQRSAIYTIPKSFAKTLGIEKGDQVLIVGKDNRVEVMPIKIMLGKIGPFREPIMI